MQMEQVPEIETPRENMICGYCSAARCQHVCRCSGTSQLICENCLPKHASEGRHQRFVRQKHSLEQGRKELLDNLSTLDLCIEEATRLAESIIAAVGEQRAAVLAKLQQKRARLAMDAEFALVEAEAALGQEPASDQSDLVALLLNYSPGSLTLFTYSPRQPNFESLEDLLQIRDEELRFEMMQHLVCSDVVQLQPRTTFQKGWRLRNTGKKWPEECKFVCTTGCFASCFLMLPPLSFSEEYDVRIDCVCPSEPGVYDTVWQCCSPSGSSFGVPLPLQISVIQSRKDLVSFYKRNYLDLFASVLTECEADVDRALQRMQQLVSE